MLVKYENIPSGPIFMPSWRLYHLSHMSQFARQKIQNRRIRTLDSPLQFLRLPLRYHLVSEDHGISQPRSAPDHAAGHE